MSSAPRWAHSGQHSSLCTGKADLGQTGLHSLKLQGGYCARLPQGSCLPCVMRREVGFVSGQQHLQLGVICKASCPIEEDLSAGSCGQKGQQQ